MMMDCAVPKEAMMRVMRRAERSNGSLNVSAFERQARDTAAATLVAAGEAATGGDSKP